MAFKVYVRIEIYWVPMVDPQAFPIYEDEEKANIGLLKPPPEPIPIACYYHNGLYWSGFGNPVPPNMNFTGLNNSSKS